MEPFDDTILERGEDGEEGDEQKEEGDEQKPLTEGKPGVWVRGAITHMLFFLLFFFRISGFLIKTKIQYSIHRFFFLIPSIFKLFANQLFFKYKNPIT